MVSTTRTIPRFLPTLTEVVRVAAQPARAAELEPPAPVVPDVADLAIAESVRTQVDAEMDVLLRDAVASAMLEQVDAIAARLREQIEPILRQAVAEMVAEEIAARRHD